jgi:hypothetical protein
MFDIVDYSPWPIPHQLQWSSGPSGYDAFAWNAGPDELRGPEMGWADWSSPLVTTRSWKSFKFAHGLVSLDYTGNVPSIDHEWRGYDYESSGATHHVLNLKDVEVSAPLWMLPVTMAPVPCLWVTRACRSRLCQRSRRRRGLCVHCGYNLRHSPLRCPECGVFTPC